MYLEIAVSTEDDFDSPNPLNSLELTLSGAQHIILFHV